MVLKGEAFGNDEAEPIPSTTPCVGGQTFLGFMALLNAVCSSKSGRRKPTLSLAQLVERKTATKRQVMGPRVDEGFYV